MGRFSVTRSVGRWLLCGDNFLLWWWGVFAGGFGEKRVFGVVFGGVGVVICVADVEFWQSLFLA
jgi:hypothetical protein